MGRPKGEPTQMIRVPTAMVVEIRALIRDRKLVVAGPPVPSEPPVRRTRVKPEALAARAAEIEAKVQRGIDEAGRGEAVQVSFAGGDSRQPEGVVCGQCGRAVPSLRYRGRQHAASCSRFDRTVA